MSLNSCTMTVLSLNIPGQVQPHKLTNVSREFRFDSVSSKCPRIVPPWRSYHPVRPVFLTAGFLSGFFSPHKLGSWEPLLSFFIYSCVLTTWPRAGCRCGWRSWTCCSKTPRWEPTTTRTYTGCTSPTPLCTALCCGGSGTSTPGAPLLLSSMASTIGSVLA